MEGNLYKWNGYFSGWAKRYCRVSNGQLDAYFSQESMNKGENILESYHVALCEISVDPNTNTQWELRMPNSVIVYLKTDTTDERKKWLRILGSVKACMMDTSSLPYRLNSSAMTEDTVAPSKAEEMSHKTGTSTEGGSKTEIETEDEIKKQEVDEIDSKDGDQGTDLKVLLDPLCDQLKIKISSLQDTLKSDGSRVQIRSEAEEIGQFCNKFRDVVNMISENSTQNEASDESETSDEDESRTTNDSGIDSSAKALEPVEIAQKEQAILTFFSDQENSFDRVKVDAEEHSDPQLLCSVQTELFLTICQNYTTFFDLFGSTLFTPLKTDIVANVQKVKKCAQKNPVRYVVLQHIITDEIEKKEHKHPDSTTQAVLWTMRGLRTIGAFFRYTGTPGQDCYKVTTSALDKAYRECLKPHHNFIVQKMFIMGIKLLPSFTELMTQVRPNKIQPNPTEEAEIAQQMVAYSEEMYSVIKLIEKVYTHHKISL